MLVPMPRTWDRLNRLLERYDGDFSAELASGTSWGVRAEGPCEIATRTLYTGEELQTLGRRELWTRRRISRTV
jgi:hypothetical protein